MPDKPARAAAYYKFLQFPTPVANNLVEHRAGLYYSVTLTHHGATTTTFKDDEKEEEEDETPCPPPTCVEGDGAGPLPPPMAPRTPGN